MELLTQRMTEYMEAQQRKADANPAPDHRPRLPLLPPLITWFIRDGDENLVDLPEPQPKPKPQPRQYRPASYWRAQVERIEAQMSAVAARADVGDRAAAGGCALGPKRTARHQKRADAALTQYVALSKKLSRAKGRLCSAEARERKAKQTDP
ncbi:hypothetical protein EB73_07125 [Mycobacterium sp. SWH-M3]|nr:hypothetical protein EB73_07125 [Mycobacterium sp. SWH-M3]